MECSNLQRQATYLKKSLFDQGYLDDQFYQLEDLQDAASPNFVEEVVTLCFSNSSRLLSNIEHALGRRPQDFCHLDNCMDQFIGSASSIGALKVKKECFMFQEFCDQRNIDGCARTFQRVKREHSVLRQKLEAYFQLLSQTAPIEKASY